MSMFCLFWCSRSFSFRFKVELKWFLMWLSVLPGSNFAILDHWLPMSWCSWIIFWSSSSVHLFFLISGFKWLCHLIITNKLTVPYITCQSCQGEPVRFNSSSAHRTSWPSGGECRLPLESRDPWPSLGLELSATCEGTKRQFSYRKTRLFVSSFSPEVIWNLTPCYFTKVLSFSSYNINLLSYLLLCPIALDNTAVRFAWSVGVSSAFPARQILRI